MTTLDSSYDLAGNRTSLTCPQCAPLQYTYDALGRLTFIAGLPFFRKEFQYDALSRLTRLLNGVETTFAYNDASQLLSLASSLPGKPLETVAYTYDPLGNRASLTDRFGLHQFGYDPLHRLLSADHPLASGLTDEAFTYDPVGNRRTSHLSASHTHNAANRLLEDDLFTYTYDANGNLTSKTDKATLQTTTYTYDVENQLIQIDFPDGTVATYRYDGLGRRIEKQVGSAITRFLYDQEDLLGIFMGPTNCQTHAILHGPGLDQPLAFLRDTNGDCSPFTDAVGFVEPRQDLVTDGLGSVIALTSEVPGFLKIPFLAERVTYDSFGSPRITGPGPDGQLDTVDDVSLTESALGNPFLFTGREYDPESGLYYSRARYYDPRTGRFLQEDPIEFFVSANAYAYATNNPLRFTDPLGLLPRKLGPFTNPAWTETRNRIRDPIAATTGVGSDVTIGPARGQTVTGDQRPPFIGFSHEMGHARDAVRGALRTGQANGIPNREIDAVRLENKIRGEHGLPARTTYGGRRIP